MGKSPPRGAASEGMKETWIEVEAWHPERSEVTGEGEALAAAAVPRYWKRQGHGTSTKDGSSCRMESF